MTRQLIAFEECKGPLRHAWFDIPTDWTPPFPGTPFTVHCERCGTQRRDVYDLRGELMTRRYIYPAGYKHVLGSTKLTMLDRRLLVIKDRGIKAVKRVGDSVVKRATVSA